MSEAAAATAIEGTPTVATDPSIPRGRLSDMDNVTARIQLPSLDAPPPANTQKPRVALQQPPAAEPAAAPELQPLEGEQPEEQPQDGVLTPEEAHAKYTELMAAPDLDLEAFADKTIWVEDREGNQVPLRVGDIPKHVMLYRDYQHKTTEFSRKLKGVEQRENTVNAFGVDFFSGDPDTTMRAVRWACGSGPEAAAKMKALEKSLIIPYVQRMAKLEELSKKDPYAVQEILEGERARDEAIMLKRQLQARQQQEQQWQQQQAEQQGINAPDIQHVMGHLDQRLPEVIKALRVTDSPAFRRELGEVMLRATEGERGPDGRWLVAPTIQRGRTPTDDVLRQLVGAAKERVDLLIAQAQGRQPPRSRQLPPPPAATAVTGPAAKPGQRGNISQPERLRWSDMGKPR